MKLYNIVKVYTATTGTGTVTLGSAVPSFITFATAGVTTGSTVSYAIEDGNNREVGTGVYTSGAETLTRNVVTSTNSNNLITLSGNAVVFITGLAADLSSATANTASTLVLRDGSGNFAAGAATLSSVVFNGSSSGTTTVQASATASGTLTLPATTDTLIGKATSDTLTNKTYDTAGTGNVLKINGTQISAVTGSGSVVLATSPTLVTPALGTPTSGTLTSCTGLPISTGVSGLGTGVATFLGTPSSANLASAVTDETGSGALVFGTSPTIATPTITTSAVIPIVNGGTAASSTLTLQSTSGSGTSDAIIFKTASQSERMRIDSSGNVGIANSAPLTRLHVGAVAFYGGLNGDVTLSAGTIMVYQTATDGASLTWNANTNGGNSNTIMAQLKPRQDTSANYNLDVFCGTWNNNNSAGTAIATFQSTGKVGIGAASPKQLLHVAGQGLFTSSSAYYDPGDNAGAATRIGYNTSGDYGYLISSNTGVASKRLLVGGSTVEFLVSGAEKGRFNSDGKFGIGTTSPLTTLQVGAVAALNGDVTISAGTSMVYQVATDGASLTWNANTNAGNTNTIMAQLKPRQDTSANYNLDVFCGLWNNNNSAGTAIATFQSTGRVGIGTASPTYQLQLSTDSAAKPTTNTWTIASDARLKTVKGEYSKGLAEICQVRPVLYEYNGRGGIVADGKEHISILAQELAEVFPECVGTFKGKLNESDAEETDLYNYNGHAITFALINAIKELKAEIDLLKSRN